jgi:hypothetical protein
MNKFLSLFIFEFIKELDIENEFFLLLNTFKNMIKKLNIKLELKFTKIIE